MIDDDDPMVVETLSDTDTRNDFELNVVKKVKSSIKESGNKKIAQTAKKQRTNAVAVKAEENVDIHTNVHKLVLDDANFLSLFSHR